MLSPVVPKGRGGELWTRLLESARKDGYTNPELFADSCLRVRERALEIKAKRHAIQRTNKTPTFHQERGILPKVTKPKGPVCKATKMDGKPCTFRAVHGAFCLKHLK